MRILLINGPNINMLGIREKEIYGNKDYKYLVETVKSYCKKKDIAIDVFQSNYEGAIVEKIQQAYNKIDGIIINPAAFTHTSIAILDALKAVNIPTVEVHISNIDDREEFRKKSYISLFAEKTIKGHGLEGYLEAVDYLKERAVSK